MALSFNKLFTNLDENIKTLLSFLRIRLYLLSGYTFRIDKTKSFTAFDIFNLPLTSDGEIHNQVVILPHSR